MNRQDLSKAERTRQYVIAKVAPVFNKKGYAGTSLSDLTAATGLTKGSIYGNFRNKDEVALCAFEYNVDFIVSNLSEAMEHADTQVEKLLAYPRTHRKIYKSILSNGGCPILNTAADADDLHNALHVSVMKRISLWKNGLVRLIERGIEKREIVKETDARRLAEIIIALIEGGSAMAKASGEDSYMLNAVDEVERLIQSVRQT